MYSGASVNLLIIYIINSCLNLLLYIFLNCHFILFLIKTVELYVECAILWHLVFFVDCGEGVEHPGPSGHLCRAMYPVFKIKYVFKPFMEVAEEVAIILIPLNFAKQWLDLYANSKNLIKIYDEQANTYSLIVSIIVQQLIIK